MSESKPEAGGEENKPGARSKGQGRGVVETRQSRSMIRERSRRNRQRAGGGGGAAVREVKGRMWWRRWGEIDTEEVAWGQCILPLFSAGTSPLSLCWLLNLLCDLVKTLNFSEFQLPHLYQGYSQARGLAVRIK